MLIQLRKRSVQFIEQEKRAAYSNMLLHEGHQRWRKMWLLFQLVCCSESTPVLNRDLVPTAVR